MSGLAAALSGGGDLDDLARRAGTNSEALRLAAGVLGGDGPTVILWGERLSHGDRGRQAVVGAARACAPLRRGDQ